MYAYIKGEIVDITEDNVSNVMQYLDFVEENRLVERRRLI